MSVELKDKIEELGRLNEEFKASHTKELNELKKNGSALTETTVKVDKLNDAISNVEAEMKSIKVAMNRTAMGRENEEVKTAYQKDLNKFLRKGVEISQEVIQNEFKDMSVIIDEDGGFLVDAVMSNEIVKQVYESSPMRQLASVQTISSNSFEIMQDLDEVESGWVGEKELRNETATAKLKKIAIPTHELFAQPAATQKILDDASINIESFLAAKASEKFTRDEATAFISGDGSGKPKGILSYDAGTAFNQVEQIETVGSGVIEGNDLIDLVYGLKGAYKNNAQFLMKRETIKVLRKLKDLDGQYLWMPGLNGSTQSSILGYAVNEADDMNIVGAGNLPIAFGDFRQGYQIVDRTGIRVLRDPYTKKPFVLFYFTKRVGGAVKNFEAFKLLKVKA